MNKFKKVWYPIKLYWVKSVALTLSVLDVAIRVFIVTFTTFGVIIVFGGLFCIIVDLIFNL